MADELANTEDLLGCSAALALLGDFAGGSRAGDLTGGSPVGAAALLAEVSQQLDDLLGHPELLLRCQALRVRATLNPALTLIGMPASKLAEGVARGQHALLMQQALRVRTPALCAHLIFVCSIQCIML